MITEEEADRRYEPGRTVRFRWSSEINLGHVLVAISMLAGAALWAVSLGGTMTVVEDRVARNERNIEKLQEISAQLTQNQSAVAKNLEVLTVLFNEHVRRTEK